MQDGESTGPEHVVGWHIPTFRPRRAALSHPNKVNGEALFLYDLWAGFGQGMTLKNI